VVSGLVANQAYLLRYAWSPDMACVGGRLCAEGCGMTILIAQGAQLRITVRSCTTGVMAGCGLSLAVLAACLLAWAWRRPWADEPGPATHP